MSPSYVMAGFLARGQTSSFDSQASINTRRKTGEGMGCMPPKHGKGEIKRGRPSSGAQERVRLQEAQTEK